MSSSKSIARFNILVCIEVLIPMSNSVHTALNIMPTTEANDSNWKVPCFQRLQELLKMRFSSPVNQMQTGVIEDTMSFDLYHAVRDEKKDVNNFLNVLENVCEQKKLDCSTILHQATPTGDSLLHVAAEFGRKNIAELLVDNNFLLHVTNIRKDTPLHVAARAKNIGVMTVILSKFEDADKDDFIMSKNVLGNTALHEAILSKHQGGLNFLLGKQSESTQHRYWDTYPDKSPIYVAVQTGDVEILRRLLRIPFPSDHIIYNCCENSPLHAAIAERNIALLKEIVGEKEQLMYLRDEHRDTTLHFAACVGYVKGVRELLKRSTFAAFHRNSNGNLPIHLACERGHVQVVKELLGIKWPYSRFGLNNEGQNILHIAAECGQNKMVEYLLKHPKIHPETLNEKDLNGDTPLHLASKKLHLWTLFSLSRDKKICVNLVNNQGLTARDIVLRKRKVPMTHREFLSHRILRGAGVPRSRGNISGVRRHVANEEWNEKDGANMLMLVAILIATVTFAAGFTIPGGVYSSDHLLRTERGMAVLANQTLFKIFMACNTVALYSSTVGSIILLWMHLGDRHLAIRAYYYAKYFVPLALVTMPVAFMAAARLVVSNNASLAGLISVIEWSFISVILFIGVLGFFPLGIRLPILHAIGDLVIWTTLHLFYGRNDIVMLHDQVSEIHQNDQRGKANQVNATQVNQVNPVPRVDDYLGISELFSASVRLSQ